MNLFRIKRAIYAALLALGFCVSCAQAMETLRFDVQETEDDLSAVLRNASRLASAYDEGQKDTAAVLGAALSDYANLVSALYSEGYYGGEIRIIVDGQEAREMSLLKARQTIEEVRVSVVPGRAFRFGQVDIGPSPGAVPQTQAISGKRAKSTDIGAAVAQVIDAWRAQGHAKVKVVSQRVVADHRSGSLDVTVKIDPGPLVRIGNLRIQSQSTVRADRIRRIAGWPRGAVFSPKHVAATAQRLRRTGAFSSVTLSEAEILGPNGEMDGVLNVVDAKPRRFGVGAELSSFEGIALSGFWLHRNFLSGAERLRLDAEISNIGGQAGGINYGLGSRLEVPAAFGSDTLGFALAEVERLDEPDYRADTFKIGVGAQRLYSDQIEAEIGLNYEFSETTDDIGDRRFQMFTLPLQVTWDRRDDPLNAAKGTYFSAVLTPFLGVDGTASGLKSELDLRAFTSFGLAQAIVLAGRFQLGSVIGPDHLDVRPDYLFFSGGGGSVRGQPYQSLDVNLAGGTEIGGRSFIGLSAELRARITKQVGAVLFSDAGYIGAESFADGSGTWHSGAGIGLRYQTGLGPIRFDVATPLAGDTGDGLQLYLGIGQAF